MLRARRTGRFTEWDGNAAEAADLLRLQTRASPTSLETYAACGFRYFCRSVLYLNVVEEPDERDMMDAATRGSLIHDVLERFFAEQKQGGRPALEEPWTVRDEERLMEILHEQLEAAGEMGQRGLPIYAEHEARSIRSDLKLFLGCGYGLPARDEGGAGRLRGGGAGAGDRGRDDARAGGPHRPLAGRPPGVGDRLQDREELRQAGGAVRRREAASAADVYRSGGGRGAGDCALLVHHAARRLRADHVRDHAGAGRNASGRWWRRSWPACVGRRSRRCRATRTSSTTPTTTATTVSTRASAPSGGTGARGEEWRRGDGAVAGRGRGREGRDEWLSLSSCSSSPTSGCARRSARRPTETLFVEAGAGTGKTRSLVDRVVALVAAGTPIERIAAITFTERAATELRERVRTGIEERLAQRAGA